MNSAANPTRIYYVEVTIIFDRPELRGSSYLHAPQAHTSHTQTFCKATLAGALSEREFWLTECDFAAEYTGRVEVYSKAANGSDGSHGRLVRKAVYRVRDAGAEKPVVVADELEQFARRMAAKDTAQAA